VVAEMVEEFKKRKIRSCAYYSVNFNNWAFLDTRMAHAVAWRQAL